MKKVTALILTVLMIFSSFAWAPNAYAVSYTSGKIVKANVKVYQDAKLTKLLCLKKNSEYYLDINDVKKVFNYETKLSYENGGYIISDFQNWRMTALSLRSSYAYIAEFEKVFELDKDNNLILKEKGHQIKNLTEPLIIYASKDYVSLTALQAIGANIKITGNRIDMVKNKNQASSTAFYTDFSKKNGIELEDVEVFESNLFDTDSEIPAYFNGFNIIANYTMAKLLVESDVWLSSLIYKKNDMVNPQTQKDIAPQNTMYYKLHVDKFNDQDGVLEVSFEGTKGILLSMDKFSRYMQALDEFAPYGLLIIDPKKTFGWSKQDWDMVDTSYCWEGMTTDMLKVTLGKPDKTTNTKYNGQAAEEWSYYFSDYNYDLIIQDSLVISYDVTKN